MSLLRTALERSKISGFVIRDIETRQVAAIQDPMAFVCVCASHIGTIFLDYI
jgi:hypothetical protein